MTTLEKIEPARCQQGYTLFEILLALAIVAVLLGISVPLVTESFRESEEESISKLIEQTATAARSGALETGEAKRLGLDEHALVSKSSGIPGAELPKGWKLQVRRFTETRFRRPERGEFWEFNGAGICEPITLKIVGEGASAVLQFDPLTAQLIPVNE